MPINEFWQAKANSNTTEAQKKLLHDLVQANAELLEEARVTLEEKGRDVDEAERAYDDLVGPQGFPRLVSLRRSDGILLPFTVTATKNSSLLLSDWRPLTSSNANNDAAGNSTRSSSQRRNAECLVSCMFMLLWCNGDAMEHDAVRCAVELHAWPMGDSAQGQRFDSHSRNHIPSHSCSFYGHGLCQFHPGRRQSISLLRCI